MGYYFLGRNYNWWRLCIVEINFSKEDKEIVLWGLSLIFCLEASFYVRSENRKSTRSQSGTMGVI